MEGLVVGRIVHYVTIVYFERPAIVVNVIDKEKGIVNLQVFGDTNSALIPYIGEGNLNWESKVPYSEEGSAHTWHWIERE